MDLAPVNSPDKILLLALSCLFLVKTPPAATSHVFLHHARETQGATPIGGRRSGSVFIRSQTNKGQLGDDPEIARPPDKGSDQSQRDTCGYCILYLLKIKNRGVMAASSSPAVKASQGPKSGTGKVTYPNRSTYEGQFNNSMRHGQGVLTLSDGTRYVAQWKNDERHGEGKEFCPDGTTFEGHYVAGMRHGYGVMKWPEGSKYSGMFERGRANGQGELLRTDGSVYKGQFCEDCMSGEGRMRWRDGVEYIGQFVANKREGYGTMTWMSGRWKKYSGQWKDGMQNEIGVLVDHNDQEFKGYFKMGKLDYWIDDR
ncbi:MORN repeat-containing protein 1 [Durusdinium trenchii]|uniref:MORN repeat-containing protein 1 n=1 Tax=Durusdinium trenchii TaxID=1381693 RepID=A0ABP0S480_9DINO